MKPTNSIEASTTESTATVPDQTDETRPLSDTISTRAYLLWEAAGQPDGRDQEFWLQAESELNGQVRS